MIEFNIRIDFFRDLEDGPKGYVGSALRDGLRALVPLQATFALFRNSGWERGLTS
jgi:hypothetical protein